MWKNNALYHCLYRGSDSNEPLPPLTKKSLAFYAILCYFFSIGARCFHGHIL